MPVRVKTDRQLPEADPQRDQPEAPRDEGEVAAHLPKAPPEEGPGAAVAVHLPEALPEEGPGEAVAAHLLEAVQ